MAVHSQLTGDDLHEPKGVESATAGELYVADGAGSGAWQSLDFDSFGASPLAYLETVVLNAVLADVSAVSFILVPIPLTMTLQSARLVLGGGITTADAAVSFTRNGADSMGSAVTITQAASAEGTSFTFTPSANQTVTGPGYIKIASDGGSDTTQPLYISLYLLRPV